MGIWSVTRMDLYDIFQNNFFQGTTFPIFTFPTFFYNNCGTKPKNKVQNDFQKSSQVLDLFSFFEKNYFFNICPMLNIAWI